MMSSKLRNEATHEAHAVGVKIRAMHAELRGISDELVKIPLSVKEAEQEAVAAKQEPARSSSQHRFSSPGIGAAPARDRSPKRSMSSLGRGVSPGVTKVSGTEWARSLRDGQDLFQLVKGGSRTMSRDSLDVAGGSVERRRSGTPTPPDSKRSSRTEEQLSGAAPVPSLATASRTLERMLSDML